MAAPACPAQPRVRVPGRAWTAPGAPRRAVVVRVAGLVSVGRVSRVHGLCVLWSRVLTLRPSPAPAERRRKRGRRCERAPGTSACRSEGCRLPLAGMTSGRTRGGGHRRSPRAGRTCSCDLCPVTQEEPPKASARPHPSAGVDGSVERGAGLWGPGSGLTAVPVVPWDATCLSWLPRTSPSTSWKPTGRAGAPRGASAGV